MRGSADYNERRVASLLRKPPPRCSAYLARHAGVRVSEVVAVEVADIAAEADGSGRLTVHRAKTDQEGRGAALFVGGSTMRRLATWRDAAGIEDGPLFRRIRRGDHVEASAITDRAARSIIQARAAEAGIGEGDLDHADRLDAEASTSSPAPPRRARGRREGGGPAPTAPLLCRVGTHASPNFEHREGQNWGLNPELTLGGRWRPSAREAPFPAPVRCPNIQFARSAPGLCPPAGRFPPLSPPPRCGATSTRPKLARDPPERSPDPTACG